MIVSWKQSPSNFPLVAGLIASPLIQAKILPRDVNYFMKVSIEFREGRVDKAFEILIEQYRPMLLSYTASLLYGDVNKAEDIVQDACFAAHQRLETFRQGENFACWLRGIVRNKVLESQRAFRLQRVIADSRVIEGIEEVYAVFDAPALDEEPYSERMHRWIKHCVGQLSQHLKNAIVRVYSENMSLRQAAAAEDASSDAIAKRLSRARELIRQCVREQSEKES